MLSLSKHSPLGEVFDRLRLTVLDIYKALPPGEGLGGA